MAYRIQSQDVPFFMFSVFTGENKIEYLNLMLLIDEMTEDGVQEAIAYDYFAEEAIKKDVLGPEADEVRVNMHVRKLANAKLVRRQIVYNDEKKEWEDSVLLSGYGRKFIAFLKELSRSDLDEAKDYQITNVRRIMRDLASRRALPENRADLLMAAFTNMRELIYHLSGFNAEFADYVTRKNKNQIKNAQEASQWINEIMGSKYIVEFYTICDDSLGYVSQISEIAINAAKIMKSSELTGLIIQDRKKKAQELRDKKNIDDIGENEIEKQVRAQIRRIHSIAETEYSVYIKRIIRTVNSIIKRTFLMYSAFGAEIGGDNILSRMMKLIRYVEKTGDEQVLENLMNLYNVRVFTEESFVRPLKKAEEAKEYPDPVYLFDTKIKKAGRIVTRGMKTKEYIRTAMKDVDRIRLDSLPCGNDEEFCRLIRIVYIASDHENHYKEYATEYISGEPLTSQKGIYTIPNIYILKLKKEA